MHVRYSYGIKNIVYDKMDLKFFCFHVTFFNKISRSCPEVFSEKGVLRNFTKFTGKHLHQSLFFPVIIAKFVRTPFFYTTLPVIAYIKMSNVQTARLLDSSDAQRLETVMLYPLLGDYF